jgi:hypothetical protein
VLLRWHKRRRCREAACARKTFTVPRRAHADTRLRPDLASLDVDLEELRDVRRLSLHLERRQLVGDQATRDDLADDVQRDRHHEVERRHLVSAVLEDVPERPEVGRPPLAAQPVEH